VPNLLKSLLTMLRNSRTATLFAAIVLLALGACGRQASPPPQGKPAVTVVTLRTQPVTLTRELPGRTTAYVVAEVRPQVTGIVKERLFTEGSQVEEGEALYQLDDATYRAAYNSARASLARAEARLEVARLDAERASGLVKINAVSKQDYENAVAELSQAKADVGVAEAQVASTEVTLGYARIKSPIDGRVGKSAVTRGALVTGDQSAPLTTVQQLDPIYVDVTQSAGELLQLRQAFARDAVQSADGLPVTILLEDGTAYEHQGQLTFSDVAVDPMTGSLALRIVVPNPDHLLMPGMYVRAVVSNAVLEKGLLVPQQAIARDPKGNATALVVTADGTVEQRAVATRQAIGDQWLVSEGLAAGDRVIVEGLQKVRPGAAVDVTATLDAAGAPAGPPPAGTDTSGNKQQ